MKIHGHEKRRGWIKVHVAVDPKTQELIAIEVTDDKVADSTVFPKLIEKSPKIVRTMGLMTDLLVESIYTIKVLLVAFLLEDMEK